MKIELSIRRQAGSTVKMGDKTYRFIPDESGRHVAEVEDDGHIDRLLAIKEFRAVDDGQAGEPGEVKADGEPKRRGGRKAKVVEQETDQPGEPGEVKAED